ncbi:MAG: hypothetical protein H6713_36600 [Myxococcales bacterium]|nr:hypothetical protein [Myxococcales bacterium]
MASRPRARVRVELPPPAWTREWPRGLRPVATLVSHDNVALCYRTPAGERIEVALDDPGHEVRLYARVLATVDDSRATLRQLRVAVQRRVDRRGGAAVDWVRRLRARGAALDHGEPAPGESAVAAALRRCYAAALELGESESLRDATRRALEGEASQADDASLTGARALLLLAAGALDPALTLWSAWERAREASGASAEADDEDRVALLVRVAFLGLLGARADAAAAARALSRPSNTSTELARVAVRLLYALDRPGEALACARARDDARALEDAAFLIVLARDAGDPRVLLDMLGPDGDAPALEPGAQLELARALVETGAFVEAEVLLTRMLERAPAPVEPALELAKLKLWRLQLDEAEALARRARAAGPTRPYAAMVLGAAAYLRGRPEAALPLLEEAYRRDPAHVPTRLWRIRTLNALGRAAEAADACVEGGFDDSTAWQLVRVLAECARDPKRYYLTGRTAYIFRSILRDVFADEREPLALDDPEQLLALTRRALERLGGNLSSLRTFTRAPGAPLELAPHVDSPRLRAQTLQERLRRHPPEEVRAGFDAFARAYPEVPFAATYSAEISLWIGDYERAAAVFDEVWRATRTRWGYVGAGASYMLLGQHERALARWAEGREDYTYLPEEATHTYQGELWRRRGEPTRALEHLDKAVNAGDTFRLGGWINYALANQELGRRDEARRALDVVQSRAPLLIWEATRADGASASTRVALADAPRVLEEALRLMRGNRSSRTLTYLDRRGRLYVQLPDQVARWRDAARFCVAPLREALARRYLELDETKTRRARGRAATRAP